MSAVPNQQRAAAAARLCELVARGVRCKLFTATAELYSGPGFKFANMYMCARL